MRRPFSAQITPTLALRRIVVELSAHRDPVVTLEGEMLTEDRRVSRASEARIVTQHLTPAGREWIAEMRQAFAGPGTKEKMG